MNIYHYIHITIWIIMMAIPLIEYRTGKADSKTLLYTIIFSIIFIGLIVASAYAN